MMRVFPKGAGRAHEILALRFDETFRNIRLKHKNEKITYFIYYSYF